MNVYVGEIPVVLDDTLVEALVDMAGYGIGYWATSAEVDTEAKTYTLRYLSDDDDGYNRTTLTFEEIAEALITVSRGDVQVAGWLKDYARVAVIGNDAGDVDSELADVVIQVAIFGEIVYG